MSITNAIADLIKANLDEILSLRQKKKLKEDESYVSEGDLLCESLVKSFIKNNYTDYYLVSEESPDENEENSKQDKVIILDPIDGTENFVSGLKEWGVAVCVYEYGKHISSLLALPELDTYLFSGETITRYESRIFGISSGLTLHEISSLEKGFEYRIMGCAVYNMYNVVTGRYACFENPKGAKVWDIIPGLNIALENNLNVLVNDKKYEGQLLSPSEKYRFKIW